MLKFCLNNYLIYINVTDARRYPLFNLPPPPSVRKESPTTWLCNFMVVYVRPCSQSAETQCNCCRPVSIMMTTTKKVLLFNKRTTCCKPCVLSDCSILFPKLCFSGTLLQNQDYYTMTIHYDGERVYTVS